MDGDAFTEARLAGASDRLETIDPVNFGIRRRELERRPSKLCWRNMDARIERRKVGLQLRKCGLRSGQAGSSSRE